MPHKTPKRSKAEGKSRKLKQPEYKSFRLHKRIKHSGQSLPSAWSILKASVRHIFRHKKVFLGITAIYLALSIILVRGFILTSDIGAAKEAVQELFTGAAGQIAASLTVLNVLLSTNTAATGAAAVYQSFIVIIISLAIIWALRQTHAGQKISLKDAFYKSAYPFTQFVLVILVIGLQLLPLIVGNFLYAATVGSGISTQALEVILWTLLALLLALWSLYMVSASAFALYIVTLPDMAPLQALRSARNLVQLRRWTVLRKVIFLPFMIVVVGLAIMLPVIMFLTPVAELTFLLLSAAVVAFSHSYMYSLYRELL